jgi:long-subunit acyl-CoA synthetase (AMP-forming)
MDFSRCLFAKTHISFFSPFSCFFLLAFSISIPIPIPIPSHCVTFRPEWVIFEQALYAFSGIPVPLYDTLGQDAAAKIVVDVQMISIVCSLERANNVAKFAQGSKLKNVIFMDNEIPESVRSMFEALEMQVLTMEQVETAGITSQVPHRPPAGRDIATFCFTSGTVGESKSWQRGCIKLF